MLSLKEKKLVNLLKQKKYRERHSLFIVEGVKMVEELLQSDFIPERIYGTSSWISSNPDLRTQEVSEQELSTITSLKTPNEVLALVKWKEKKNVDTPNRLTLALDNIQDPGNLGTIIRTADWFGIRNIVCSPNCVELYNPKVVQATMGALFRVNILYTSLSNFFSEHKHLTIYGSLLEGENVYKEKLIPENSILLMGNESKGISENLMSFIDQKIGIPRIGNSESLNVAIATAIFCSEFTRT